jgi:hypothetical protein
MLLVAAWKLHNEFGNKTTQLDFTREVVAGLVAVGMLENIPTRPGPSGHQPYFRSPTAHFLQTAPNPGRCRHCSKNTRMLCKGCNVRLHLACFEAFHNSSN